MHKHHLDTHIAVKAVVEKLQREGVDINLFYGENYEDLVSFISQLYT